MSGIDPYRYLQQLARHRDGLQDPGATPPEAIRASEMGDGSALSCTGPYCFAPCRLNPFRGIAEGVDIGPGHARLAHRARNQALAMEDLFRLYPCLIEQRILAAARDHIIHGAKRIRPISPRTRHLCGATAFG
jgi:hypothetical protein